MKKLMAALATAGAIACLGAPAMAHHGLAKQFDMSPDAKVTLTGTITRVAWQNPHIYFAFETKDDAGALQTYSIESVPVAFARNAGLTSKRLRGDGQSVELTFRPSLKDELSGFGTYLKYEDGFVVTFEGFKE